MAVNVERLYATKTSSKKINPVSSFRKEDEINNRFVVHGKLSPLFDCTARYLLAV